MKQPAPAASKEKCIFDVDESKMMIGYRYLGLLPARPHRTATKGKKKTAKRPARAAAAR